MAKVDLEAYILEKYKKKEVDICQVFDDFYGSNDEVEIKELEKKRGELKEERAKLKRKEWKPFTILLTKSHKETNKIKARIIRRNKRIQLAFNQLFLEGLVKIHFGKDSWLNFNGLKKGYIDMARKDIKSFEEIVKKGNAGIMEKCWLSNLYDYLEKAQKSEIIRTKDWNKLIGRKNPGKLICTGSELCHYTFPERIRIEANLKK